MATAYAAGAANLPFGVLRGYRDNDLVARTTVRTIACPYTGEELAAVRALRPDVGIVHAQRADRAGNVQLWGIIGVQKETVLASERSLVTVEEIVDELEPVPGAIVIPTWAITCVSEAPGGAKPSYAQGYYARDNEAYRAWDEISREPDRFGQWLEEEIYAEVRGRDLVSGLPKVIVISTLEIREAIEEPTAAIVDAVKVTLDKTPPELAADIMERGIVITGGGAQLIGLENIIQAETGMPVHRARRPLYSVVLGSGQCLENFDVLHQVLSTGPQD